MNRHAYWRDWPLAAGLALCLLLSLAVERHGALRRLRDTLQCPAVPTALLRYGTMGRIVRDARLFQPVRNKGEYPPSAYGGFGVSENIFQKKRSVGQWLYTPYPAWPAMLLEDSMPSLTPPPLANAGRPGWPLLSLRVRDGDLWERPWGILRNPRGHGREWERPAVLTLRDGTGRIREHTRVGVRLHGGTSRFSGERNFRVYFRDEYGDSAFDHGGLLGPSPPSIDEAIVHADWPGHVPFVACLAYDVARQIGCLVPHAAPILFELNGQPQGVRFLCERVNRQLWVRRTGHKDFVMHIFKAAREPESLHLYGGLHMALLHRDHPLTPEAIRAQVDLDNLSRFALAAAFCGFTDTFQGAAVLDRQEASPRWRWINWDMDHSFWDPYGVAPTNQPWLKPSWELLVVRPGDRRHEYWLMGGDARSVIFTRLIDEDPAYRAEFATLVTDTLNHRITPEWLQARVTYYEQLAQSGGMDAEKTIAAYRAFFRARPRVLIEGMTQFLRLGSFHTCRVEAPDGFRYSVDGHAKTGPYEGWYPAGATVRIAPADVASAWRINGRNVAAPELVWKMDEDVVVTPEPNAKGEL
ncbi:MAG: CotH kinase family protein [Kiritimatiellae bacterium]|nr:CotH kinase family protein [Kiritimatiellia bacterium]